jgi:hypothetical protein
MFSYWFVLLQSHEYILMKMYHVQFVNRVIRLKVVDQMFQQVRIPIDIKIKVNKAFVAIKKVCKRCDLLVN